MKNPFASYIGIVGQAFGLSRKTGVVRKPKPFPRALRCLGQAEGPPCAGGDTQRGTGVPPVDGEAAGISGVVGQVFDLSGQAEGLSYGGTGILALAFAFGILVTSPARAADVSVTLSPAAAPAVVDPNVFGLFQEEHFGDLVPGIWEQYIVNPSFEPWYEIPSDRKTREPLANPRAPYTFNARMHVFPLVISGSHTLEPDSTSGNFVNSTQSLKITTINTNSGGAYQMVTLPYTRRKAGEPDYGRYYELRFWAKKSGLAATNAAIRVRLSQGNNAYPFEQNIGDLITTEGRWITVKVDIGAIYDPVTGGRVRALTDELKPTVHRGVYAQYRLWFFTVGAIGDTLWIDQATLTPYDAVGFIPNPVGTGVDTADRPRGYAFNPDTLANLRDRVKPAFLRWPGGNFTSTYDWRDGTGPADSRPSRPNLAWGGVDANEMGIDEFVEFCRLVGAKPLIGAASNNGTPVTLTGSFFGTADSGTAGVASTGVWITGASWTPPADKGGGALYDITPVELGDWVEYCNAATGALADQRKANVNAITGNTDPVPPYNIEHWGVGNEVYGSYQFGNDTGNVANYITKLTARAQEMKTRPSAIDIKIMASAFGVHNEYNNSAATWTTGLLASDDLFKPGQVIAGKPLVDYIDLHHYIYGPGDASVAGAGADPAAGEISIDDARRATLGATQFLETIYADLRTQIAASPNPGTKIMHLEWGVNLNNSAWTAGAGPRVETFANGLAAAAQLNAFIKNANLVAGAAWHNFSGNFSPVANSGGHSYPVHPRTEIFRAYAENTAGKTLLDTAVAGSPVYDITVTPPLADGIGNLVAVPEIDAVATINSGSTGMDIMLLNRSLTASHTLAVTIPITLAIKPGESAATAYHAAADGAEWTQQLWGDGTLATGTGTLTATGTGVEAVTGWQRDYYAATATTSALSPTYYEAAENTLDHLVIPPLQFVHLKLGLASATDPRFVADPQDVSALVGTSATLAVSAKYATAYQWFKDGAAIPAPAGTGTTFALAGDAAENGAYTVVASNENPGSHPATSQAATVLFYQPLPDVTVSPADETLVLGTGAGITLTGAADGATSYQWTKDGVPIATGTAPTLKLAGTPADAGVYVLLAFNNNPTGFAATAPVTVTILPDPDSPLAAPAAIVAQSNGRLYTADAGRHIIQTLLKGTGAAGTGNNGNYAVTFAGRDGIAGDADADTTAATFNQPAALAIAGAGTAATLYIADAGNNAIRAIPLYTGATLNHTDTSLNAAQVATLAGAAAGLNAPGGLAADTEGNLYVADTANHAIRLISRTGVITTLAGTPGVSGTGDALGIYARFNSPTGLSYLATGTLFIADTGNHTIRALALATGSVTTLAGAAGQPGSDDGAGAAARFREPRGVIRITGTLYVADTGNHTIRAIRGAGNTVTTLAGYPGIDDLPGVPGFKDATGTNAWFNAPAALATPSAASGTLYIADTGNRALRALTLATGAVTTLEAQTPAAPPPVGDTPKIPTDKGVGGGAPSVPALFLLAFLAAVRFLRPLRRHQQHVTQVSKPADGGFAAILLNIGILKFGIFLGFGILGFVIFPPLLFATVPGNHNATPQIQYKHWTVTAPVFAAGPAGSFDEVAVKDPTIVRHNNRWHLFYTAKPRVGSEQYKTALGYATAPAIESLRDAPHIEMREILGDDMIAPQVFYFAPQKLWYLIGHISLDRARRTPGANLQPVYSTNPDIENVRGWSKVRELKTARAGTGNWIDFWIICDDAKAHLFYTTHSADLFRMECPLADFPRGFATATETPAPGARAAGFADDKHGFWSTHEAAHIYRVKSDGKYLCLFEAGYPIPTRYSTSRKRQRDARTRFMLAFTADKLEGPWRRVEAAEGDFFAEASALYNPDGTPCTRYTGVSHPELIRAGADQRLEIENYNLTLLFQSFDATGFPDTYDYQACPWDLALMRNY